MRRRRAEYLEEMSTLRALDTQIENLREVRRAILETEMESETVTTETNEGSGR